MNRQEQIDNMNLEDAKAEIRCLDNLCKMLEQYIFEINTGTPILSIGVPNECVGGSP